MVVLLALILAIGLAASCLPFLFPDSLLSLLGVTVNRALGGLLANTLNVGQGSLVTMQGEPTLTFQGVLALYVPPLAVLLWILRGR